MGIEHHCRWVRHRLPLLIGGELKVDDKRRVERHLIGCVTCRGHRDRSNHAFSVLRTFAEDSSPVAADSPSLWPALADQIRRSRHASPGLSWWETPLPRAWAALGLAMGLIALVASPLALLAGRESARSMPRPVDSSAQLPPVVELPKLVSTPTTSALPSGRPASPDVVPKPSSAFDPTAPNANIQFSYDLDRGTLTGPANRDPQHSY